MKDIDIFAKGIYPTNEIYPMLKNCLITNDYFICSNDYISLCYKFTQCSIKGCYDTKIILNTLAQLKPNVPYTVNAGEAVTKITQGAFELNISKIPTENYPITVPDNFTQEIFYPRLIEIFRNLYPFIGIDASRMWCLGIHIKDKNIYTTNNTVCCGVINDLIMKDRFIPTQLVEKIIQLADKNFIPEYWIDNDNYIGVIYKQGHIFFCKKSVEAMDLSKPLVAPEDISWMLIDDELRDSVKKVVSFTSELYVDFNYDIIQTNKNKDYGAKIKYKHSFNVGGAYIHKYFIPLLNFCSHLRFYENKAMFYKKQDDLQYYFVEARYVI